MEVTLIDHMGTDLTVVNAARVSFDKESNWEGEVEFSTGYSKVLSPADYKLIKYLAKHNHWTPFGHPQVTFRVKAPIFVARQLGKHQVGMVWNEVSRRYVDSEPEFFTPDVWRSKAENVKQGSSEEAIPVGKMDTYIQVLGTEMDPSDVHIACKELYLNMLKQGCCPEQARMVLPQSMYTEWFWTGSLAAWARVCKLRLDSHTQKETREIAEMISVEMDRLFPVSWDALTNKGAE